MKNDLENLPNLQRNLQKEQVKKDSFVPKTNFDMYNIPWISFKEINSKTNYHAHASFFDRKDMKSFSTFLDQAQEVQQQLKASKGLVGYSIMINSADKKGELLSVWENAEALTKFAHSGIHAKGMNKFRMLMAGKNIIRWKMLGSQIPQMRQEATKRFQSNAK